jgi:hypothetical protein
MSIARLLKSLSIVSLWVLCGCVAGCLTIPIPFRPGSSVLLSPGTNEESDFELRADKHWPWGESLGKTIAHRDQRIVIVDPEEFLTAMFPDGNHTLSQLLLGRDPDSHQSTADCILFVGSPHDAKPKDAGVGPFLLGYAQTKRAESAAAILLNLRNDREPMRFSIESHYAQTTAGVGIVGVATIGVPENAVRRGVTSEVIRLLAREQPSGLIRLVVLPYFADQGPSAAP